MKPNSQMPVCLGGIGPIWGTQYRQGNRVYDGYAPAMALTAQPLGNAGGYTYLYLIKEDSMENKYTYRIRKLTPKECWRLMGWQDEQFHKAEAVNSNTQLYKQAGNGIVVPVLEAIFRQMGVGRDGKH